MTRLDRRHATRLAGATSSVWLAMSGVALASWLVSGTGTGSGVAADLLAPGNLQTNVSGSTVTLTWNPDSFPDSTPVQAIEVYRSTGGGSAVLVGGNCAGKSGTSTGCSEGNVPSGTSQYHLVARHQLWTEQGAPVQAVVSAPPPTCPDMFTPTSTGTELPIALWPIEAGTGTTITDTRPDPASGASTGGATWVNAGAPVPGGSTWSLGFDGVDDKVTVAGAPTKFEGLPSISVSLWFWTASNPTGTNTRTLAGRHLDESNNSTLWRLYQNSAGLVFQLRDNKNVTFRTTAVAGLANSAWHHAVATYDHPTQRVSLFVDGGCPVQQATSSPGASGPDYGAKLSGNSPLKLIFGSDETPAGRSFPGRLDDIRFFDRALPLSEVKTLFNGS